jgi:hypothetical protein
MTLKAYDIKDECQLMQLDIMTLLTDKVDSATLIAVCQVIVDRCSILQQLVYANTI